MFRNTSWNCYAAGLRRKEATGARISKDPPASPASSIQQEMPGGDILVRYYLAAAFFPVPWQH